jgi:DNA-binding response OmpR family regulator
MLEAMQGGAGDYLDKPFDQLELKARLLVGKTKPTGSYMRRSKTAGIVWSTSTKAARCARRMF